MSEDIQESPEPLEANASAPDEEETIRDTDIVFDCPHCGHSLVIDNRGAGLVISCVNCGNEVQVPIPEGMDISDLDQEPENLQLQLRTLRTALLKAESRERELQKLVAALTERRSTLEKARSAQLRRLADLRVTCERVQQQLTEASLLMGRIFEKLQDEMKQ